MSRDKRGVVNPVVGGSSPPATAKRRRAAALVGNSLRHHFGLWHERPAVRRDASENQPVARDSAPASAWSTGTTWAPMVSIACMSFSCGSEAAFI
jgi:hypothetical protein